MADSRDWAMQARAAHRAAAQQGPEVRPPRQRWLFQPAPLEC